LYYWKFDRSNLLLERDGEDKFDDLKDFAMDSVSLFFAFLVVLLYLATKSD